MMGLDAALLMDIVKVFSINMIKNLEPLVTSLMGSFLVIDLTLSFLFDDSQDLDIFMKLMKKILYYGFWIWIIQNYNSLIFETLFGGAIQLGNVATGSGNSTNVDLKILGQLGISSGELIGLLAAGTGTLIADYIGIESVTTVLFAALIGYVLFFIMLCVQIITTFIKFFLMAGYAYILMPFGCFTKTKDIAMKALNGLFSQAIEIFVIIVLLHLVDKIHNADLLSSLSSYQKWDWKWIKAGGLFQEWILLGIVFSLISKSGAMASAMLSGSIAALGIGAGIASQGMGGIIGTPGQLGKTVLGNVGDARRDYATGVGRAFRKGSYLDKRWQAKHPGASEANKEKKEDKGGAGNDQVNK